MFKISTQTLNGKTFLAVIRGGWLGTELVELFGEGVALAGASRLDLNEGKHAPEATRAFADWVREHATELGESVPARHPLRAGCAESRPEYWEAVAVAIVANVEMVPAHLPKWA